MRLGTRSFSDRALREATLAFTLLEVMIACGIFFMCTFAILALVSNTLRNARALQRAEVDIGMVAAQVYQTLKTNRQPEGTLSGDLGDAYRDYSWEAAWTADQGTNSLLQVEIVLNRQGLKGPFDTLTFLVHAPNVTMARGGPNIR